MNRKTTLAIAFALSLIGNLFAGTVSMQKAQAVAETIYSQRYKALHTSAPENIIFSNTITKSDNKNNPLIYIFNLQNEKGFVMIAAQDNVHPILGYSFEGNFNEGDPSEEFSSWMKTYTDQISFCIEHNSKADDAINKEWEMYSPNSRSIPPSVLNVSPLTTTTWNQGCYYNAQCPAITGGQCGNAWTGCGATSMAQMMKYHDFPATGAGSHSYSWSSQLLSANFGTATYNWGNMPNNVTSANADVAQLMYHCGVSLDMNYGSSGSYCSANWSTVLPMYFSYKSTIQNWTHLFISNDTVYENRIAAELDSLRPTFYKGNDASVGGHFWICDGYQNTYPYHFHMNWGWGGAYDGYYYCTALNPATYNFIYSQGAVINVMPNNVTTGINNSNENFSATIYPNPAKDNLNVEFTNEKKEIANISILDMTGRTVKNFTTAGNILNIDISEMSNAVYIVEIKMNDSVIRKKFIKE